MKNLENKLESLKSKKHQRDKKYGPFIDLIDSDDIDVAVFVQLLNKKKINKFYSIFLLTTFFSTTLFLNAPKMKCGYFLKV